MSGKPFDGVFAFGGQYAPVAKATPVSMDEWDKDLRQAKELGLTAFRIFVAWDRIELKEGVRDYREVDYALELAERHGLKVMVNIGGVFTNLQSIYPPRWLIGRCQRPIPATLPQPAERPSGPRQEICMDDPLFQRKSEEFLADAIARVAKSPAVHSWIVWNEPGASMCLCPHTQAAFQGWLKAKYKDISALNKEWSTEFPVDFAAWDELSPPRGVGFMDGGYAPFLDFHRFLQWNFEGKVSKIVSLVKRHDPKGRPSSINLTPGDVFGESTGKNANPWRLGEILDVSGLSAYLGHYPPSDRAAIYSRLRCSSKAKGGSWFVIETEAGPVYWVHGSKPWHCHVEERMVRHWEAIAHGAKSALCWMYRSRVTDAQAGEFGMLAWDGSPTDRAIETGKISKTVNRNPGVFLSRHPKKADVAILCSNSTGMLYAAETHEARGKASFGHFWVDSWRLAYRMLHHLRVPADFVNGDNLDLEKLKGYKALLIPFHPNIDPELASKVEAYVKAGGHVVADFPFGFKDGSGRLLGRAPSGLAKVFGAFCDDAIPVKAVENDIQAEDVSMKPCEFRQDIKLDGAKAIGKWADGRTAISRGSYGKGTAILAGTMLFRGYKEEDVSSPRLAFLKALLASAAVKPLATLESLEPSSSPAELSEVEFCELDPESSGSSPLYMMINHGEKPMRVRASVESTMGKMSLVDLTSSKEIPCTISKGRLTFELDLAGKRVAALIDRKKA